MLIDINIHAFDPPDQDLTYRNYLETCRRAGVTPVSRERTLGLMQEWGEVLSDVDQLLQPQKTPSLIANPPLGT